MNLFNYKNRKRFEGPHLIGILLTATAIIVGLISIFIPLNPPFSNMMPLVVCLIVIGLVFIFTYSGIEINFTKNTFREYTCFCGVKLGQWMPIPPISKIKLKSTSKTSINTPNGISPTFTGSTQEHRVILYANQPTPLLAFVFPKKEIGMKNAELLAMNLNAKVE